MQDQDSVASTTLVVIEREFSERRGVPWHDQNTFRSAWLS